jgi:GDP-4-dehydro-6-deoxy-D-mannose reductase
MRILVTGANGFVGKHLCRYLASVGDEVVPCPGPDGPGALDVINTGAVAERIATVQPDGIVHLAGVSSVAWSHANPSQTFLVNCIGTVNVLQGIRNGAPKARLLLVGSGDMYGRIQEGRRAREDDVLEPLSPYSASKCAGEDVARQFAASYGLQVIRARPFNHIGAGQAEQFVVPSFARQIASTVREHRTGPIEVGDLSPVRDFLHVADVVRAYRTLLEYGEAGTPYNVCSGEPVAIRKVLDELLRLADFQGEIRTDPARFRPAEIPWLVGDPSRLRALGWEPVRAIQDALTEVIEEAAQK